MADYNPRNTNRRTKEAPKSTARWFDDYVEWRTREGGPCGFHKPEPKR